VFHHLSGAQLFEVSDGMRWAGVGILLTSFAARLWAAYYDVNPIDRLSYVGALIGIAMLVGGPTMLRWAGLPLAFIALMFPLPSVLERLVLMNLQGWAAAAGTWTLQLLGAPAMRDGNKLIVDQIPLEVAEACSGLRMTTIFVAMSIALAILMVERPWWDRLTILISAIPVALATNVIRITITALLLMLFPENTGLKLLIHDWAGLAMMPIAMGILWLELELLRRISVPIDADDYAAFGTING
ncbi:MAG: exosortase/archaeosortase family protein, partial [Pirellulales bacterium]|nr:exosortase/archaeosortase family protein [Pirellulales bacterium]